MPNTVPARIRQQNIVEQIELPLHIDEPPMLLIWRLDDVIPLILMMIFGIITDLFFSSIVVGFVLAHFYRKYRDRKPEGFALHWLYWHGFIPIQTQTIPNPFVRTLSP